jgi:undecaprenyl-diphosphatase
LTDVIVGWVIGLAWVGIVILAHRFFHVLRHREHAGDAPTFEHPAHLHDGAAGATAGATAGGPAGGTAQTGANDADTPGPAGRSSASG